MALQVYLFFSPFFLSPISAFFAEKVYPRWLQLNLFFVSPTCHHNLLCWESLLMLWRQDNSPSAHTISTIMSFPPPPLAPGGGGYHGRSGGRGNGKLYLATQKACAAAARRKAARANLVAPPPSTPSNRAIAKKIAAMRSRSVKHLPRRNYQVKELYSIN